MTEAQPDLLGADAPKPAKKKAATPPITEGMVRKGGRNQGPSQIKERPAPPAPMNAKAKTKKPGTAVAVDDPAKRQQVAVQQPNSLLSIIMQVATNPACDTGKMQALLDMRRREAEWESEKAFDAAFIALQAELPVIRADRKIEIRAKDNKGERTGALQQSTPYATFPGIMKAIQPLLTKHGFGLSFQTKPLDPIVVGESVMERILVTGILTGHGHKRTTDFAVRPDNSGSKNPTQAQGSGQSYGKRYCTIALLNIISEAIEDADTDGHQGNFKRSTEGFTDVPEEKPKISPAQVAELGMVMQDAGVGIANFCAKYGLKVPADLPAELFDAAKKALRDHKAQRAKANG